MKTKVIFLQNGPAHGYSYFQENEVELPAEQANELISKRVCASIPDKFTPIPHKLELREQLISNGFYSMEILSQADENDIILTNGKEQSVKDIYKEFIKR
jgi:hypothetical protein